MILATRLTAYQPRERAVLGNIGPEVVTVRTERSPGCLCGTRLLIVKSSSGSLHLKGFRHEVFFMTRGTQTKASYHEFEKQFTDVKSP